MTERELFDKIKFFISKYPNGLSLTPAETISLYLIYLFREETEEKDFIGKEIIFNAIERSFYFLSKFNSSVPDKTTTVFENLLKKSFLLYSATERDSYYLSDISISIVNGIFKRDIETVSDVESNLFTIYTMLVGLENEDTDKVESFFKHTFFDLVLKLDKKIRQLKEEIIDGKKEIKESIRSGSEDSFKDFLNALSKIQEKLKEISTSLSRYSVYNQILYQINKLEKKFETIDSTIIHIHRASRKLFSIKNELENTLSDVTEFINRHVSLITSQINISSLDKVLNFQSKILNFFHHTPIYLRKPKRLKVPDFRYSWKSQKRAPVIINSENKIVKEEYDTKENEAIKKIADFLIKKLKDNNILNFIEEIMQFDIVRKNLPRFYNKILFMISDKVEVELLNREFNYEKFYISEILLKPVEKKLKNAS